MSGPIWGGLALPPSEERTLELGSLRLSIRRRSEEVWLRAEHTDAQRALATVRPPRGVARSGLRAAYRGRMAEESDQAISTEAWIRWAVPGGEELELQPALPDRLVVVSPEQPFFLPPDGRARIFVRIPLFVAVRTTGQVAAAVTLQELPSLVLSDTWWGTFTEGELGYWLETRARSEAPPGIFEPFLAVCPLVLVNRASLPLPVERFAVRVAYLTLFESAGAVWTDEVQVRYEGGLEGSEIRYTGRVMEEAGEVRALAPSREPAPRGFHARTFGKLKARMASL